MDPNANLDEIRELLETYYETGSLDEDDQSRLVDLVTALDGWLTKGGFLPTVWTRDDGLHAYRVMLRDPAHDTPFAFDCRGTDLDHAREQAINAYPQAAIVRADLIWQDAGRGEAS